MNSPTPNGNQLKLDPKKYIVSKTDPKGVIEYGNDYFVEISGYQSHELIGRPHNIIRHPDMPAVVFKMMWDRLKQHRNIFAVVKNLAKDGSHYWVVTEFETKLDPLTNEILHHSAYRKAASQDVIDAVAPLYKKLLTIERESGLEASEKYFAGYLDEQHKSYDEFIDEIIGNKGVFKFFFQAMKKMFGG